MGGAGCALLPALLVEGLTLGPILAGCAWLAGAVFGANVLGMTTEVARDALTVRFGVFFTYYRKRFPIEDIRAARCVEYRPLRNAGGWGIRFGRFEGKPCRFLNARGRRGVFLETVGKPYIIGSETPEALCAAILQVVGQRR